MMHGPYMKLHSVGFGLAIGIVCAVFMFITGLFATQGFAVDYVKMVGSMYVGYGPTFIGSILGAVWGFLDGFVFGVISAALYNLFTCCGRHGDYAGKCCCKCGKSCDKCECRKSSNPTPPIV